MKHLQNRLIIEGDLPLLLIFLKENKILDSEKFMPLEIQLKKAIMMFQDQVILDLYDYKKKIAKWYLEHLGCTNSLKIILNYSKDRNILTSFFDSFEDSPQLFIKFLSKKYPHFKFYLYWNKPYANHFELDFFAYFQNGKDLVLF
jgi:hypothetical protein